MVDPKAKAPLDVFVMNFATHVVFDYAPGSLHPESSGTITVVHKGSSALPSQVVVLVSAFAPRGVTGGCCARTQDSMHSSAT